MSVNTSHDDMAFKPSQSTELFQDARSNPASYQSIPTDTTLARSRSSRSSRDYSDWDPAGSKMSPARRTFCLFTAFDLILSFILWVIYTQLIGITPIWNAFDDQVKKYTFETSMFDTVMISTARFTFIMLAYALFRIRHWWVIAISTSMTCVYLLFKCFLFEFNNHLFGGKNPLSYVVLIVCFVLAWLETWMLDFKVIPSEQRHKHKAGHRDDERSPLLSEISPIRIEDTGEYYSPYHTPEGSDDELEQHRNHNDHHPHHQHPHLHQHHERPYDRHPDTSSLSSGHSRKASDASMYSVTSTISTQDLEHYTQLLNEAKAAFLEMLHMDGWKLETGKSLDEGVIYSQNIKKFGRKIFKLQGIINMRPHDLWKDMVATLNESTKWNPTILESRTLQHIDENMEINYSIAAEAAGGLVSARDFVSLRQWSVYDENMFINVGIGTTHPDMPAQKKYVRGDNGPGGWAFQPVPDDPNSCIFTWIVNTNLKGWLPQAAIDQAMSGVLSSYFKLLKEHYRELLEQRSNGV